MRRCHKTCRWLKMKALFIDNFDFTYSLADEFEKKGCEVLVYRNDADLRVIDAAIKKFKPSLIVVSGSGSIKNSGNSSEIISAYHGKIPIFGIGVGHHCIISLFDGKTIFKKIENPFQAGMHSLMVGSDIPYVLEVSARNENDAVMAVRHKEHFVEGVQFNPESILTPAGSQIIDNLL